MFGKTKRTLSSENSNTSVLKINSDNPNFAGQYNGCTDSIADIDCQISNTVEKLWY